MATNSNRIENDPIKETLLTDEMIEVLMRRAAVGASTVVDFQIVDHYMTSVGRKGFLKRWLRNRLIFSFEEAAYASSHLRHHSYSVAGGALLGCLRFLDARLYAGEKIY